MTTNTLVPYDLNASATVAATGFFKALLAAYEAGNVIYDQNGNPLKPLNAGQGAEPAKLPLALREIFQEPVQIGVSGLYKAQERAIHKAMADFYRRFMGIDATAANTFYANLLGRSFQMHAESHQSDARIARPGILVPVTTWPMIADIYRNYEPIFYDPSWDDETLSVFAAAQCYNGDVVPMILYAEGNNNPTGAVRRDFTRTMAVMDAINSDPDQLARRTFERFDGTKITRPLMLVLDYAYYHVALRAAADAGYHLETGLNKINLKGITPVMLALSGSKALGLADPGNAVAIVSDNLVGPMGKMYTYSGFRQAGVDALEDKICRMLAPTNDPILLERFGLLGGTYEPNRDALVGAFGNRVYPGEANLVGLVGLDTRDVLNRAVRIGDEEIITRTVGHLVWALGNMTATAVVDNGIHGFDGNALVRFAFPGDTTEFAERMPVVAEAVERIKASPYVPA